MINFIKKIVDGFAFIFKIVIPKGKDQIIISSAFFVFYAIFSFFMFEKYRGFFPYREVLNYDMDYWLYIFSNKKNIMYSLSLKHPLITQIYSPFILLFYITKKLSVKYMLYLIMFFFNAIAALSINIIYKYCTKLLKISIYRSILICFFFGLFAHVLLLSFIPESFQLTTIGLLIMVYYTTENILTYKKIPVSTHIIMFCYSTGVTITNSVKAMISQLFVKGNFRSKIKTSIISGISFLTFLIIVSIITKLEGGDILYSENINQFIASTKHVNVFHDILAEPLLFHHNYTFWWGGFPKDPFQYNSFLPIIFIILFYVVIICSIFINIKEKSALFLLSFLGIDILIHIIFGFGILAASIYCLHWLFIFPLLIAWLYKAIKHKKLKIVLDVLVVGLAIFFAVNNLSIIAEFVYPF